MATFGGWLPLSQTSHTLASRSSSLTNRAMDRISNAQVRQGNRLTLLRDGPATYDEWLREISNAKRWVHLENYIFWAGEVGHAFADALSERAAAGVPVRVLVDWFGSSNVAQAFWEKMRAAGVEVRMVNPPTLGSPLAVMLRDHRKLVAVDGRYASTGGVCIADGWLECSAETGLPYRDTAVGVRGPAVADLERAFAGMWDVAGGGLPDEECPDAEDIEKAGEEVVRVILQEPGGMRILRLLEFLTLAVEERLWITDPYFLSAPLLYNSLTSAACAGVDVRLLLPLNNDHPAVAALSRTGYQRLLESGARIFEYKGPMMHAKTSVADSRWSRVGSTNLNIASLLGTWELDLVIEGKHFGRRMEQIFEDDLANTREVRLVKTAQRPKSRLRRSTDAAEHRAGRGAPRATVLSGAVGSRLREALLRKEGMPLRVREEALVAVASAAVLGASLAGIKFPRLAIWPLAAAGISLGGSGLVHSARWVSKRLSERSLAER